MSTGLYYPKYYVLEVESIRDKPRVKEIIENCRGAQKLTKDEAVTKLSGLSAPKRYALGKQTLYIKEIKRSSVHFFSIPKGAIENPQLIINHGMICPHFCHYCYWQKDLYSSSMITVHANPKEDFVEDIKIASIIWRAFSPLISSDICKDKVSDTLFLRLDRKIRKKGISSDDKALKSVCLDFVAKLMEDWKIPKKEQKFIIARIKNPAYKPNVIFDSGENNDSVALEHITNIQNDILIPTILSMDNAYLILRTKSIYFGFLEKLYKHPKRDHIIISPSINPHYLIEKYEPGNHSLEDRLESLRVAAYMGFKIFLCFSPMIYERGSWRKLYADFVEELTRYLPPEKVHYYTVGSLRLSKQALRNIKNIHPGTPLDSPYFIPPGNTSGDKFRYSGDIRRTMYAFLIREMNKAGYDKVPRYLQTETIELWQSLMTDQYKDLNLDIDSYRSGRMELEALTDEKNHLTFQSLKQDQATIGKSPNWRSRMYLLMSALQKAIRWCEVNDARYFAQELNKMGKPGATFNRLMVIAAEDIGLADPTLVQYVRDCVDRFETMLKEYNTTRSKVADHPEICDVIDRAVIAAALSYKSRLLPMLTFAPLFEIYKKEDFIHDVMEYENRLRRAIQRQDEKESAYYAYILALIFGAEESVFEIIEQASEMRNRKLINEWIQQYKREKERLLLAGSISLLCRDIGYPHGEYRDLVPDHLSLPIERAEIPDRAYDMHTHEGMKRGRGLAHFFEEGATVKNERFPNDWEEAGKKAYLQAEKEGLAKAAKLIKAIKERLLKKNGERKTTKKFIINLPFTYKTAVLTQARTSSNRPYAFIVEFHDGSRKFMKGPWKTIESAWDHVIYNDVKRRLESQYLYPIHCEVEEYDSQAVFLVCQEIGKADLDNVEEKETKLDGNFEVLTYASNDVVPDPLNFLTKINEDNQHIWIGMVVNYCFRWVFGLGDAAPRNLMLQRSTGNIYSTDEIFLKSTSHDNIWGGKRPAKEKFELIRAFAQSALLNDVLIEVKKWKNSLDSIRSEVAQISKDVERRIDQFLKNPETILGIWKNKHD